MIRGISLTITAYSKQEIWSAIKMLLNVFFHQQHSKIELTRGQKSNFRTHLPRVRARQIRYPDRERNNKFEPSAARDAVIRRPDFKVANYTLGRSKNALNANHVRLQSNQIVKERAIKLIYRWYTQLINSLLICVAESRAGYYKNSVLFSSAT
jgi:hypothetical protein